MVGARMSQSDPLTRAHSTVRTVALLVAVIAPVVIDITLINKLPAAVAPTTILTACISALLIWRSRAPALVFWTMVAGAGGGLVALSAMGLGSSIFVCLPLAAAAYNYAAIGRRMPTILFVTILAMIFAAFLIVLYSAVPADRRGWEGSALALLLMTSAWSVGLATRGRLDAEQERADLAAERARNSALRERERIAQDLHDGLAHHLSALVMRVEAARANTTRSSAAADDRSRQHPALVEQLAAISADGRHAVREITAILDVLHGDRQPPGFAEIDDLIARARADGVDVRVNRSGPTPPAFLGSTVYRVLQESLSNARRHGAPGRIDIDLIQTDEDTNVTVSNPVGRNRRAPSRSGKGLGLPGIRNRVVVFGGEVSVTDADNRFVLHARIPVRADFDVPTPMPGRSAPALPAGR